MKSVRLVLALVLGAVVGRGQGIEPRPGPEDYAASVSVGSLELAAELKYRIVVLGRDSVFLREGVVIEVALFGPKSKRLQVSPGHFSFRINGKEPPRMSSSAEVVLFADKWGEHRAIDIQVNDGNIRIGGPDAGPRFPGDPRTPSERLPRVEEGNAPRRESPEPIEILRQTALPNGAAPLPIAGHIYLHYKKKIKSIKKLELLYRGPGEEAVLRLK